MIITQKFHSAKEIDQEFIAPIEELLKSEVPSFDWIIHSEENSPESIHYTYYLFFGPKHNSPIGFGSACIENKVSEPNFLSKFVKTHKKSKHLIWKTPGVSSEGIILDPLYQKEALTKVFSITDQYNERKDIDSQQLLLSSISRDNTYPSSEHKVLNGLMKNQASYKDYLQSLKPQVQDIIKSLWQGLHSKSDFKIGEYSNIKEAFEYKNEGSEQYKDFKTHKLYKLYNNQISKVITFETSQKVEALIFIFNGVQNNIFADFYKFNPNIDPDVLIQAAIMEFYENNEFNSLNFLRQQKDVNRFVGLGFRIKSQNIIQLKDHA